jgi:hypothetical protein
MNHNDFKAKSHEDALVLKVKADGQEKEKWDNNETVTIGAIDYTFFYGSKAYVLPFKIKLNDFIASKYPGTEKVTLRLKVKLLFKILQILMPEYL